MRYILGILAGAFFLSGTAFAQQAPCKQSLRAVTSYANTVTTEATQLKMKVAEFGVLVADLRNALTEAKAIAVKGQKELDLQGEIETEDDGID